MTAFETIDSALKRAKQRKADSINRIDLTYTNTNNYIQHAEESSISDFRSGIGLCIHCEKEFKVKRVSMKFCNKKCRQNAWNAKKRKEYVLKGEG